MGEGHQEITQLKAHWVSRNLSCVSSPRSCSNPHVPQDVICPNCEEGASMPQACARPPAVPSPCSHLCPPLPIIRISRHVSCLCSGLPSSERGSKDTDQSEQRGGAVRGGEGRRPPDDHRPPPPTSRQLPAGDETGCVFSGGAHGSETRGTGQAAKQQAARSWKSSFCHRVPRLS